LALNIEQNYATEVEVGYYLRYLIYSNLARQREVDCFHG